MENEDRVMALEVKVAYQEQQLAELDEVVREFAKRVEALERITSELQTGDADVGPALDPPPHY